MENKRTSVIFRIIFFTLTAAVTAFVFINSSLPADLSEEESQGVLDFIYKLLLNFGIDSELSDFIIRKIAHFTEFTALGALYICCAYSFDRLRTIRFLPHALLAGILTAVADEAIQLNVEGRSSQVTDVILDFSGVVFGAGIMLLIFFVYKRIKSRRGKYQGRT